MSFFKRVDGGLRFSVEFDTMLHTHVFSLTSSLHDGEIIAIPVKDVKASILRVPEPPKGETKA